MKRIALIICLLVMGIAASWALYTYQIRTQVVTVGTSATKLPSSPLVGRRYILIQNVGDNTVYIGNSNVTADENATGGIQLQPYAIWEADYDHTVDIYGIVASGTGKVVVEEGK